MTRGKSHSLAFKLISLIRNIFRVFCVIIFFHWILWFTTYANCIYYRESIDKSIKEEKFHHEAVEYGKEKKTIAEIEEEILSQIEEKKAAELGSDRIPRKWKEKLPELEGLQKEIKELRAKENRNTDEEETLKKKEKDYKNKLQTAKENANQNIHKQLEKYKLDITELDDGKSWGQSLLSDPLRFFFISPLHWIWKSLHIPSLFGEIVFKLIMIKLLWLWIRYSGIENLGENMEKLQNPALSVEEREEINKRFVRQFKYQLFNGVVWVLFNWFVLLLHPFILDRTHPW